LPTTPAVQSLLAARNAAGHWEGELSSSALSTATAVFALSSHDRSAHARLIDAGIAWLLAHQNPDGGWGDTVCSKTNISTTALCWAALTLADASAAPLVHLCEAWLSKAAGGLDPDTIARAVIARYGKDRTFSVPILTMCALAGRLGPCRAAWRHIPQLPFELAACPYQWFQWIKLPVVSYALPALIAIGHVRHVQAPTRNPVARLIRRLTWIRSNRVLESIQPSSGGFLEATPLTSFVLMSLIGSGQRDHAVVPRSVEFLTRSARADGSWPIDTNLATWLTTLSVNALARHAGFSSLLPPDEREKILTWLLGQQYRVEHPYTHAAPGGWAWTDLPGGVPDADDTAGALVALHHLAPHDPRAIEAATAGVTWLLDLQNRDGGIPTFCRGWGALPFDCSGTDLTAHALHAWHVWRPSLPPSLQDRITHATRHALRYLDRHQRPDGSWSPLWFGNEHVADEANPTYGTARMLAALHAIAQRNDMVDRATRYLLSTQNPDGSWGGAAKTPGSIEETSLAVTALAQTSPTAARRGREWLIRQTNGWARFPVAPIGFYFAKLWYFERLYPLIFATGASAEHHF
jgi:squalene-hopene/tetraprenyl-beta-curcumene cyclase